MEDKTLKESLMVRFAANELQKIYRNVRYIFSIKMIINV